ncbi:MAG: LPS assembly lipoprotein LptE [Ginsengibacter sp.]|jgi:outer membrane lipopolysaccharide assembly protein LptE/RlpB
MKITLQIKMLSVLALVLFTMSFATCKYSTRDTSPIPPEVKTFRVNYFQNKARYINPQLSPQLTEKLQQKIISQTRLRQVNDDDAHYDISGYVSDYSIVTSGVSNQQAGKNRLNITFHLIFKNTLDNTKNFETDLTTNYDFDANLSQQQAEALLSDQILKNVTEGIFNKIFSNW